jgi:hypothetical protein
MRAILTINYNGARLLNKQVETLRRFVKGPFDFHVGDNSTDSYQSECIQRICEDSNSTYIKLNFHEGDPSRHHGRALNHCLNMLHYYDQVLILDHDCIPYRSVDIFEKYNEFDFAGIHQIKGDSVYLAPIFLLINKFNTIYNRLDLLPCAHMDTGGSLKDLLAVSKVKYVNEFLMETPSCYYAQVDDSFMHFIKGSGWDGNPNHESRINSLYEKLEELINESN